MSLDAKQIEMGINMARKGVVFLSQFRAEDFDAAKKYYDGMRATLVPTLAKAVNVACTTMMCDEKNKGNLAVAAEVLATSVAVVAAGYTLYKTLQAGSYVLRKAKEKVGNVMPKIAAVSAFNALGKEKADPLDAFKNAVAENIKEKNKKPAAKKSTALIPLY